MPSGDGLEYFQLCEVNVLTQGLSSKWSACSGRLLCATVELGCRETDEGVPARGSLPQFGEGQQAGVNGEWGLCGVTGHRVRLAHVAT